MRFRKFLRNISPAINKRATPFFKNTLIAENRAIPKFGNNQRIPSLNIPQGSIS
jgi:hypothetical protein